MKQDNIIILQKILNGLLAGSQQHFIHATITKSRGFNKLADKMLAESREELSDAERIINRILQLGGSPSLEWEAINIYQDPETQLREECKLQHEAMAELQKLYSSIKEDVSTQNLLQEYINSETEHASWLEQQVNLMQLVGVQNYLATQI